MSYRFVDSFRAGAYAMEFSPGGSSSYTTTDRANRNKTYINETIQDTVDPSTHTRR